jgi:hypothetical protein
MGHSVQPFARLTAGDTWRWSVTLRDFPATDYTLKLYFRGTAGKIDIVATPNGSSYDVLVPASSETDGTDTDIPEGTYSWQACVFNSSAERTEVGRGSVEILANIAAKGDGYDGRSWVKQTLDAIRANLLGLAGAADQEYQIHGRMLRTMDRKTLLDLEGEFEVRYRKEQKDSGQLPEDNADIQVRFGRTCGGTGVWK